MIKPNDFEHKTYGESVLIHGDCLEVMPLIPDNSVDMILCDLPYGTTACNWDVIIPFDKLWEQYNRIMKPNGAICLFGREPFTSKLVISNIKNYKHKWVWNKKQSGSFQNAKYMPLQVDEDIVVFSNGKCNYYPIMRKGKMRKRGGAKEKSKVVNGLKNGFENYSDMYYPINIYELVNPRLNKMHPTEKPTNLIKMFIETYSIENDMILDNTMGSGTTCVGARELKRRFIGIEKEKKYYDIAVDRVDRVSNLNQYF